MRYTWVHCLRKFVRALFWFTESVYICFFGQNSKLLLTCQYSSGPWKKSILWVAVMILHYCYHLNIQVLKNFWYPTPRDEPVAPSCEAYSLRNKKEALRGTPFNSDPGPLTLNSSCFMNVNLPSRMIVIVPYGEIPDISPCLCPWVAPPEWFCVTLLVTHLSTLGFHSTFHSEPYYLEMESKSSIFLWLISSFFCVTLDTICILAKSFWV